MARCARLQKNSAGREMLKRAGRPVRIAGLKRSVLLQRVRPTVTWRNFPDHKTETKAVKEALKKAGIEAEVKKRIDVPVIPKIPEVVPEKKPEVKQNVESKPEIKRKRQKYSQPEIVMTELGKTVIKKARG